MILKIGKQYIVDVTDKGIIPIDEFSTERFFDKDNDDLDFLTDEEKTEVINKVLADVKAEIKAVFPPSGNWMYDEDHEHEHTVCEVLADVLQILDNVGKADMRGDKAE